MGNFRTVVCDLDGVLYRGSTPVDGGGAALERLAAAGIDLLFATNNASATPETVAGNIESRTGFRTDPDTIVTSAIATADLLAGDVGVAFVIGVEGVQSALTGVGIDIVTDPAGLGPVDAVVVGLDRGITYGKLAAATTAIRAGARFVATNDDATFPTATGLAPGNGAIVASLVTSTGTQPEVCGKPHPPMAAALSRRLAPGPVVMVGDRIDTDIVFARRQGWAAALVLTGVTSADGAEGSGADMVLDSVADLPTRLGV